MKMYINLFFLIILTLPLQVMATSLKWGLGGSLTNNLSNVTEDELDAKLNDKTNWMFGINFFNERFIYALEAIKIRGELQQPISDSLEIRMYGASLGINFLQSKMFDFYLSGGGTYSKVKYSDNTYDSVGAKSTLGIALKIVSSISLFAEYDHLFFFSGPIKHNDAYCFTGLQVNF